MKIAAAVQGVQLIGRPEEGPGIEDAPQDLLDRVTTYLIQERGKLRADAASSTAGRVRIKVQYSVLECTAVQKMCISRLHFT